MSSCGCNLVHEPHRIVITGGPGAGKTAVLEVLRARCVATSWSCPKRPASCSVADFLAPTQRRYAEQRSARSIDAKIAEVWSHHPRRFEVPATVDFFAKARQALAHVTNELPACCRDATAAHLDRSATALGK